MHPHFENNRPDMKPSDPIHPKGNAVPQQKAVISMRSALKYKFMPLSYNVFFDIGIRGQQSIPMAITLFAVWSALLTLIRNQIQTSSNDDCALIAA